jgi:hypothetical protein
MGTQVKVAWVGLLHSERSNEVEFIPENPLGNKIELFWSAVISNKAKYRFKVVCGKPRLWVIIS